MSQMIGIDLGTTNSLIACFDGEKPQLIANAHGQFLTPSAISIGDNDQVLVGQIARERLVSHPERSAASFKRLMGSDQITQLGKFKFRPEELSALVLKSLKQDAELHFGRPVDHAVISVPAYFSDRQRKATIEAGRIAGLKVQRLVNEPTAAALAFGLADKKEGKFLVFDLGGGTFDISILDKFDDVIEIKATTGDTRLGGDDFATVAFETIARKTGIDVKSLTASERGFVLRNSEIAKHALSAAQATHVEFALKGIRYSCELTRQEFENGCAGLLNRLRQPTERAVRDSQLSSSDFDAIVLVGGATRMPMIRSLVARMFGRLPMINVDPDHTVALGAAAQSGLIARNGTLRDIVMTDVCPYTLGVASVEDPDSANPSMVVSPIIERNAIIPISRSIVLSTVTDRQRKVAVEVYQGENLRPQNNIHLGTIEVPVPAKKRGEESIEVRLTYDINGTLQVEVTVISTGKLHTKVFSNGAELSENQIEMSMKALAHLKLHPRDQVENTAVLARAERLYEEARGEQKDEIKNIILGFERDIGDQKLRDPASCRAHYMQILDTYDTSALGN